MSDHPQDIGYAGWRLDFVKGYAPKYVKEYIEDTIGPDVFHVAVSVHTWQHHHRAQIDRRQ